MGMCTLIYHGGDHRVSPFLHKDFPGMSFDARKQCTSEEEAYKFCWPLSTREWRSSDEFPSGYIVEGHGRLMEWGVGGSFGVEASNGCMRCCFNHLEQKGAIEQTFHGGTFFKRPHWTLPPSGPKVMAAAQKKASEESANQSRYNKRSSLVTPREQR